jgi:starch synthase (maltosyl-transferring)
VRDFFRPSLWPTTPDILPEELQTGGRAAFAARFLLAATLGASYGIYGPPFELCEARPREPGSEEFLDSEKYEVRHWRIDSEASLRPLIARVNAIRRANRALQSDAGLVFHGCSNERLLAYSKADEAGASVVLVVVNLDPHHVQSGELSLDLEALRVRAGASYHLDDLLGDARLVWRGPHGFVELHPDAAPGHIFLVRGRARTERDFDYYVPAAEPARGRRQSRSQHAAPMRRPAARGGTGAPAWPSPEGT